jgi:hypothetical protein
MVSGLLKPQPIMKWRTYRILQISTAIAATGASWWFGLETSLGTALTDGTAAAMGAAYFEFVIEQAGWWS